MTSRKPVSIAILKERFARHPERHPAITWQTVEKRLASASSGTLEALAAMEASGGEPDVIGGEAADGALLFIDCAAESPKGRRSLCYDQAARQSRKDHPPASSALEMAADIGIELLTEADYRALQQSGAFDLKTSSWIMTPAAIRDLGGALFCDRRYDTVFVYHNGANSYYAARGFRGKLRV